ncbi:MAG: calcium-binding protein, partial [Cyanobacteria bacterium REEB446]|nr:calcium-binding protein [Cyanobacteria bacterium REEB446]
MAIDPSGFSNQSRQQIVSNQGTLLSGYLARSRSKQGSSSARNSQGQTNLDSVSLSSEALERARLRDEDRLNEKQTNRKEMNTYKPGGSKSTASLTGDGNNNTLTGGAGNDTLEGGAGNDTLDGLAGLDRLIGLGGNDTYIVDNVGDVIVENALSGNDTVKASVTYTLRNNIENLYLTGSGNINGTGNALNNTLTGNSGNNTLDGGTGTDTLIGGAGNDTYVVDSADDVVTELFDEGTDTVNASTSYTIGAHIENLNLTGSGNINGTGNALNNTLTGNSGNNTLDGGTGTDTLIGGAGNDTYVVDSADDVVTELFNEGTDTVNASTSYTIGAHIENLNLTGSGNINGTGNAGSNNITGNSGNNTLDGGTGTDTLIGGAGNDTYVVDSADDVVTELANEGTDTVNASLTYTLGSNVENL